MKKQFKDLINELKETYRGVNFDILEEDDSIQLLYDDVSLYNNDIYFNEICDIAIKYLDEEQQNIFAILYDYYNQINILTINNFEYVNSENYGVGIIKGNSLNVFNTGYNCGMEIEAA